MKRFWHVPWLVLTVVVSFVLLRNLDNFAGMGTAMLILFRLGMIAVFHGIAFAIGFAWENGSLRAGVIVSVIALTPIAVLSGLEIRDVIYSRYYAPSDRFRDTLMTPIPESVRDIQFVSYEDSVDSSLMFRFSIASEDLEEIIAVHQFRQIGLDAFRRPDDLFTHEEYLPLPRDPSFYQTTNGNGDVLTLKVSGDRTRVIFRLQSQFYYSERQWDSEIDQQIESEALERMKEAHLRQ